MTAAVLQLDPFVERMIFVLTPYFTGADPDVIRPSIIRALAGFTTRTSVDLMNAAQVIAFGCASLDTLGEAVGAEMPIPLRLQVRGCASGLGRSGQQAEKALVDRQKRPAGDTAASALTKAAATPNETAVSVTLDAESETAAQAIYTPDTYVPAEEVRIGNIPAAGTDQIVQEASDAGTSADPAAAASDMLESSLGTASRHALPILAEAGHRSGVPEPGNGGFTPMAQATDPLSDKQKNERLWASVMSKIAEDIMADSKLQA